MNVNWNLYRQFYHVAKSGSTAAAAKELLIAQPSVSLGIKQLENQLGCELFTRSYRGMELTGQGKILFGNISLAFDAIDKAEELISKYRHKEQNMINVAAIDTTLQLFLVPLLEGFRALYPEVTVKIHICNELVDAEKLMDSKAVDFAVMHFASKEERFVNVPVMKISDILVCNEKYKDLFVGRAMHPSELKSYSLASLRKTSPSRKNVDSYLESNGVELEIAYEFMHASTVVRQIREQLCLGFLLENVVKNELERGELFKIELSPPISPRYYYLIRNAEVSAKAKMLIDHILHSQVES